MPVWRQPLELGRPHLGVQGKSMEEHQRATSLRRTALQVAHSSPVNRQQFPHVAILCDPRVFAGVSPDGHAPVPSALTAHNLHRGEKGGQVRDRSLAGICLASLGG